LKRLIAERRIGFGNYVSPRAGGAILGLLSFSENSVRIEREEPGFQPAGFDVLRSYCHCTCAAVKKCKVLLAD
jgi:hypothetical protein